MIEGKNGETEVKTMSKHDILRDINYLSKKGVISGNEVYYLIKNFLRVYLKLDYEFTKDELFKELKNIYLPYNIRADFFKFIENVFIVEYSNVDFSDEELRSLINEFKGYLDYLFISNQGKAITASHVIARNWKHKIGDIFKSSKKKGDEKQQEEMPDNMEVPNLSLQSISSSKTNNVEINSLIEKIYYSLYNSDLGSAAELYNQVLSAYSSLTSEKKVNYYETIHSVYDAIKKSDLSPSQSPSVSSHSS